MNDLLLRALKCESVPRPPIWLHRQAGRFLPEYRGLFYTEFGVFAGFEKSGVCRRGDYRDGISAARSGGIGSGVCRGVALVAGVYSPAGDVPGAGQAQT